jgi:hypothetical protein
MGTIPTPAGAAKYSSHPPHPHYQGNIAASPSQLPAAPPSLPRSHLQKQAPATSPCGGGGPRRRVPRRKQAPTAGPDGESLRRRQAPTAGPDDDLEPLRWRRAAPASGPCGCDELQPAAPPSCRRKDGGGDDLTSLALPPNPSSLDPGARRRDLAASPCGGVETRRQVPTATSSPCVGGEPRRPRALAVATSSERRRLLPAAAKMEEATASPS